MRIFLSAAIVALSVVASSAGAVSIPLSARVAGPQSIPGTGLTGRFYDQTITDPVAAHQPGALGAADGTFHASRIAYEYLDGGDSRSVTQFLGDDGDSFVGNDPGNFTNSVLTFDGFINITDEFDFDEEMAGIQVFFGLESDDGFELKIGGISVGSSGPRGYAGTLLPVEFEQTGLYGFSLLYFENGGDSGLRFGFASEGVFALSGDAYFETIPQDEVPEPAMLGLFGLGALALAATRRRR